MVTLRISLCGYLIEERSVESGAASGYRTTIPLKAIWQPQFTARRMPSLYRVKAVFVGSALLENDAQKSN
jgi:hypothetical protein